MHYILKRLLPCIVFAGLALNASTTVASSLMIRNVVPIDPIDGALPAQSVVVGDGIITAIGTDLAAPEDATIIDASGKFLIPGLWDMHVHLTYNEALSEPMADLFLDYGITSVRDTGGLLHKLLPIVRRYGERGVAAPRVYFSGPLLDGQPVVYDGGPVPHIGISNPTGEEARRNVATLVDAGASFIKIYEMVSPEVFHALVDAAAEYEVPIAAHVPLSMLASEAGPRVNSMEHLRNIEMDCAKDAPRLLTERRQRLSAGIEDSGLALRGELHKAQRVTSIETEHVDRCDQVLMSLRDTIQVPTARLNAMTQFPPFERDDWEQALSGLPSPISKAWRKAPQQMDPERYEKLGAWTLKMIARMRAAGVPIGAGTDTPIGWAAPGYSLHNELEVLVHAGLTPLEALQSATVVPARFFNIDAENGRLAQGYAADLVLLNGNPLTAISNTRAIHAVIRAGALVRGEALSAR